MKYGIKAYGSTDWFNTKKEYEDYLMEWIANTEGAERDRAVDALSNLLAGIPYTDTDGGGQTAPIAPVEEKELPEELTDEEMDRIDHIQNLTHKYINDMLPGGREIGWDLDLIDRVIEAVWKEIEDKNVCTEMEFYPYRER